MENWIKFRDTIYEISDSGRIRNDKGRIMKSQTHQKGYIRISLIINGEKQGFSVHRLVCEAFLGNIEGLVIDHINRIKSDNRLINLRVVNNKENAKNKLISKREVRLELIYNIVYLSKLGLSVNEIDTRINKICQKKDLEN